MELECFHGELHGRLAAAAETVQSCAAGSAARSYLLVHNVKTYVDTGGQGLRSLGEHREHRISELRPPGLLLASLS